MAKRHCDPKRVAVMKAEAEEADGTRVGILRFVVSKQKDENGDFYFAFMKECCTGACWIATFEITYDPYGGGEPKVFRVDIPATPCIDRNCNVTAGYDRDPGWQWQKAGEPFTRDMFETFDAYENHFQWGATVSYGSMTGFTVWTSRNLGIDFGFVPKQGESGDPREARLFMRNGTQFATLFQCRKSDFPYPSSENIIETKPLPIFEKPKECMMEGFSTNAKGEYPKGPNGDMLEVKLDEAYYGEYFFYSISNRYCPYKFDSDEDGYSSGISGQLDGMGTVFPGVGGWWMPQPTVFYLWPTKDAGEVRARMPWVPGAGAEDWLNASGFVYQAGGNVFMLDEEMEDFLENQNGYWQGTLLSPGDPLTGMFAKKLLLPTGDLTITGISSYERATKVSLLKWTRCSRNHACGAWPWPIFTYDLRPRPANMEPPLTPPYNPATGGYSGMQATEVTRKALRGIANADKYKCLHYDAAVGQCKKHGADFYCAECDDSVGLPFDV